VEADGPFSRRESARLVSVLTRVFGVENLSLAEDVVQETLVSAFEAWSYSGVPDHYSALLTTAAKNRAIDVFRRERTARKFAPALTRFIESEWMLRPAVDDMFQSDALKDAELRMMFSCCHPRLPEEGQVALILNILCGFGVDEVAAAFLASVAAIQKRLQRGKKVLAASHHLFDLGAHEFAERLSAVQRALYLLFNEGYHGASAEAVVRADLCRQAMRLVGMLVEHAPSATPSTKALASLMFLNAARLPARTDDAGDLKGLFDQDRLRWDARLIAEGVQLLADSATGDDISAYHVEARIAALHATARVASETPWGEIAGLYDVLMRITPSPVVALNRAVAIAQHEGAGPGLAALESIQGKERLAGYPFYAAALGELELRLGNADTALRHFEEAHRLARNDAERRFIDQRIAACD
jgi:RNA polymerase sigma-70 factor (ECF subfamily)